MFAELTAPTFQNVYPTLRYSPGKQDLTHGHVPSTWSRIWLSGDAQPAPAGRMNDGAAEQRLILSSKGTGRPGNAIPLCTDGLPWPRPSACPSPRRSWGGPPGPAAERKEMRASVGICHRPCVQGCQSQGHEGWQADGLYPGEWDTFKHFIDHTFTIKAANTEHRSGGEQQGAGGAGRF